MKVYILNIKRVLRLLVIAVAIICLIIAAGALMENVTKVFANGRELPIYSVDSSDKKVAITFDCAWGADDIPGILKILKDQDVKASFFIVGLWAEKHPDMVRQIAMEGHDIANHSYSHFKMGELDNTKIKNEIVDCNKVLEKLSGKKVDLFRAPYGDYNNNILSVAKDAGCFTIQWNVDSLDWKPGITEDEIMDRIAKKIKPGSIILFHNDTEHTAKILSDIITELKKDGYTFSPVSKLIFKENYIIDYEGRQKIK